MRELIEKWHLNELKTYLLKQYKTITAASILITTVYFIVFQTFESFLVVITTQLIVLPLIYAYFSYYKDDLKSSAFLLDARFDGKDFFATMLEFEPKEGIVHEEFVEKAELSFKKILPKNKLIDLKAELKFFWKRASIALGLLFLLALFFYFLNNYTTSDSPTSNTNQEEQQQGDGSGNDGSEDSDKGGSGEQEGSGDDEGGEQDGSDSDKGDSGEQEGDKDGSGGEQEGDKDGSGGEQEGDKDSSEGDKDSSGGAQESNNDQKSDSKANENNLKDNQEKAEIANAAGSKGEEVSEDTKDIEATEANSNTSDNMLDKQDIQGHGPTNQEDKKAESKRKEDNEEAKFDPKTITKASGGLGGGSLEKDQLPQFDNNLKPVNIQLSKEKLNIYLNQPNLPKSYKERLKKLFEYQEEFIDEFTGP